ncbi:MAG: hypothetical protein HC855_16680, partial [Rhizobiales bacterium]|nr:hypothetical protein [Hyphomicrobiales bacterium]
MVELLAVLVILALAVSVVGFAGSRSDGNFPLIRHSSQAARSAARANERALREVPRLRPRDSMP